MIKVKGPSGTFKLDNGHFIYGSDVNKDLYNLAIITPRKVWEGPTDYALAVRMMTGVEWETLEREDEPQFFENPN